MERNDVRFDEDVADEIESIESMMVENVRCLLIDQMTYRHMWGSTQEEVDALLSELAPLLIKAMLRIFLKDFTAHFEMRRQGLEKRAIAEARSSYYGDPDGPPHTQGE